MEPQGKLQNWMTAKGYNYNALAQELGFSDTYIFKILAGSKPLGSGFKFRFISRFGVREAKRVFSVTQQPVSTP